MGIQQTVWMTDRGVVRLKRRVSSLALVALLGLSSGALAACDEARDAEREVERETDENEGGGEGEDD